MVGCETGESLRRERILLSEAGGGLICSLSSSEQHRGQRYHSVQLWRLEMYTCLAHSPLFHFLSVSRELKPGVGCAWGSGLGKALSLTAPVKGGAPSRGAGPGVLSFFMSRAHSAPGTQ